MWKSILMYHNFSIYADMSQQQQHLSLFSHHSIQCMSVWNTYSILTSHTRRRPGVTNNINNGPSLFKCPSKSWQCDSKSYDQHLCAHLPLIPFNQPPFTCPQTTALCQIVSVALQFGLQTFIPAQYLIVCLFHMFWTLISIEVNTIFYLLFCSEPTQHNCDKPWYLWPN